MSNLYKITSKYLQAFDNLSQIEELSEEIIKDTLSPMREDINEEILSLASYIKNIESDIEQMKKYESDMSKRRMIKEKSCKRLKDYIKYSMQISNIKKVKGEEFDVLIKEGGRARLDIESEENIDPIYYKEIIIKELDKEFIRKQIENGFDVIGCRLVKTPTLTIK